MQALKATATGAIGATTAKYAVRAFRLEHSAAANATILDTAGNELVKLRTAGAGADSENLGGGVLDVIGLNVSALSAGTVYIYVE